MVEYADRMDLALAVADAAVSRAGAATVSELAALGIPAVYVPYPVGNGEQRFNAADVVGAGGGILVDDADFTARLGAARARARCSAIATASRAWPPPRHPSATATAPTAWSPSSTRRSAGVPATPRKARNVE